MVFAFGRTVLQLAPILRPILINQGKLILCNNCQQFRLFSVFSNNVISSLVRPLPIDKSNTRQYAKGKDKKKEKGKKKVIFDESILSDVIDTAKLHQQMELCVESLKQDYVKNLSLRSTSGSIETLPVKFEGSDYKLQELAQVIRQNPKSVILNMSAFPQAIPAVLEAIEKSGMNLNPQQDGTKLFIPVPKVTKELRENLAKNAKSMFVKCRTSLKDVQSKFIKSLKSKEKTNGLSTDVSHSAAEQITALCDSYVSQAEKIFIAKESELKGD